MGQKPSLSASRLGSFIEHEIALYLGRLAASDPAQKKGKPPTLELGQDKAEFLGLSPSVWGKLRSGKMSLTMETAINITNRLYEDPAERAICVRTMLQLDPFRVQTDQTVDDQDIHPVFCKGAGLYVPFSDAMDRNALLVIYGFQRFDEYTHEDMLRMFCRVIERGGQIALVQPYPKPQLPIVGEVTIVDRQCMRANAGMQDLYDEVIRRLPKDAYHPQRSKGIRLYHRPILITPGLVVGNPWFKDYPINDLQRGTSVGEWRHLPDGRSSFIEHEERIVALHREGVSRWIFDHWRAHYTLPPAEPAT